MSFRHTSNDTKLMSLVEINRISLSTFGNEGILLGPRPLKNFPSFFWVATVFSPRLLDFPFCDGTDGPAELDPSVRPPPDFDLSSDSFAFSGSGRLIAAAKMDGTSGAWTLLSTSKAEQGDELSRQ